MTVFRRLLGDQQFWVAILAALFFWVGLYFWVDGFVAPQWPLSMPWLFLTLVILYPLLEELSFRGFLQGYFSRQNWNRLMGGVLSSANILTSFLFCAFHFINHSPLWAMSVIVPSLIYGHFRDRYQDVLPAILLHSFFNLGYYGLFYQP